MTSLFALKLIKVKDKLYESILPVSILGGFGYIILENSTNCNYYCYSEKRYIK